jgi:hypothetical protein
MTSSPNVPQMHSPPLSSASAANQTSADIGNLTHVKDRQLPHNETIPTSEMPPLIPRKPTSHHTSYLHQETLSERLRRKFRENPLVPVGVVATISALALGLRAFRRGDSKKSQMYMRMRVGAQGATIIALLGGIYALQYKKNKQQQQQQQE